MVRQKVKGTGHKQPADAASEPNLYALPQILPELAAPPPALAYAPEIATTNTMVLPSSNSTTIDASPGLHGAAHLLHGIAVDMRQQAQSLPPPFLGQSQVGENPNYESRPVYTQRQARQSVASFLASK